jgi:hypothetical protein
MKMRLFILSIAIGCSLQTIYSQEKRNEGFWGNVEYAYGIGLSDKGDSYDITRSNTNLYTHSLRGVVGYYIYPQFSIGVGTGISGYHNPNINTVPLFVDFRYSLKETAKSIYFYSDLGSSISLDSHYNSGFLVEIGGGYKFPISQKLSLTPALGYNLITYKQDIPSEKRVRNSVFIKIGISF